MKKSSRIFKEGKYLEKSDYVYLRSLASMKIEDDGLAIYSRGKLGIGDFDKYLIDNVRPETRHIIVPNWMGVFHEGVFDWLDSHGITLTFLHRDFTSSNSHVPNSSKNNGITLKRLQYGLNWDTSYPFVQWLLKKKIQGQRDNLLALGSESYKRLDGLVESIPKSPTLRARGRDSKDTLTNISKEECMGIEGLASKLYWDTLKDIKIHWVKPSLPCDRFVTIGERQGLEGRNGRHAVSPFHAVLNYVGGLGVVRLRIAIKGLGLDGDVGVFHSDHEYRESLLYDLLEVMRPEYERMLLELFTIGEKMEVSQFTYMRDTGRVIVGKPLRMELLKMFDGCLSQTAKDVTAKYLAWLQGNGQALS